MTTTNEILTETARWHEAQAEHVHNMKRSRIRDRHLRIAESLRGRYGQSQKRKIDRRLRGGFLMRRAQVQDMFFVIPLARRDDGKIVADETATFEMPSADAAIVAAEAVASCSLYCGAAAFARAFNHSRGCYDGVEVLTRCGNIIGSSQRGTWVTG